MRASLYNAMPLAGVEALVAFMREFAAPPRLMLHALPHSHPQPHQPARASSACRASRYEVGPDIGDPDAILVRSADMHGTPVAAGVRAVGRAGAGVNNIPVGDMSRRGIPVFNTPGRQRQRSEGAGAGGHCSSPRATSARRGLFARALSGDDAAIEAAVEKGKKNFVGFELPGRTLGVVGLGAVGVEVANSALALGMKVLGYDPQITVQRAWQLSSSVEQALSLEDLFARSDVITRARAAQRRHPRHW